MSKRPKMLASVIREVIAPVLIECPQKCGMVSISSVEVSDDFSYATVYITSFEHSDDALRYLESRGFEMQKKLKDLCRNRIPRIRFRLDTQTLKANKLEELLQ